MVVLLSTKLDSSQKGFRQVQGVDTMRFSHSYRCLSLSRSCYQLPNFMKSGKWMSKLHSLMDFLKKSCIWCNQNVLSILKVLTKCASSSDPFMDWSKPLGVGINVLIVWSKHMVLYRFLEKPVFTRKWVGALQPFW